MIRISKATLNEDTVAQLIALSQRWAEENCTFGLIANTRGDLNEPCYIARDGDRIIGYAFGHLYTKQTKTSYVEVGAKCFELDELYVLPEYRSGGIGSRLFRALENEAKSHAEVITLSTATKDYRRILRFYVEREDMTFHSAYLIKSMRNNQGQKENETT